MFLCGKYIDNKTVCKDNWKYHKTKDEGEFLINLDGDIGEKNSLISNYHKKAEGLKRILYE